MSRIRPPRTKNQTARPPVAASTALQLAIPLDDSTVSTPTMLAMIQAIISLGLHAVEDALQAEVTALAGLWRLGGRDGGLAPLCATMPLTGLPESAPTE